MLLNIANYGADPTGVIDSTPAINAAINSLNGQAGVIYFPAGIYQITETLTCPKLTGCSSDDLSTNISFMGEGPFNSIIWYNSTLANSSALLVDKAFFQMQEMGIVCNNINTQKCCSISNAHRIHITHCLLYGMGQSFHIENSHSIWIDKCYGTSHYVGFSWLNMLTGTDTYSSDSAFCYLNIPSGGYVNHLNITNCLAEGDSIGANYFIKTNQSGNGYGLVLNILNNQFESNYNGIYLNNISDATISGNYCTESGTGFGIELDNCTCCKIGQNFYPDSQITDKLVPWVKLNNPGGHIINGSGESLYLTGYAGQVTISGHFNDIIDNCFSTNKSLNGSCSLNGNYVLQDSQPTFRNGIPTYASPVISGAATFYPAVPVGTQIINPPTSGNSSLGWQCITASNAGTLTRLSGSGPSPTLDQPYFIATAYDFKISVVTGGVTGTATYSVQLSPHGTNSYVNSMLNAPTSQVPQTIYDTSGAIETNAPLFRLSWPLSQTYVSGDTWTITNVTAPVFKALPNLAA